MQKVVVITMLFFLGLGLTQPSGLLQRCNLQAMYRQCSDEDPDITPIDFVFEHLLNLEDVIEHFEGEEDPDTGEKPHVPFQLAQSSVVLAVTITKPIQLHLHDNYGYPVNKVIYPRHQESFYNGNYMADIFHPPIV